MLQIVENQKSDIVPFYSLNMGDVFEYDSNYFIKTKEGAETNAVRLSKIVDTVVFNSGSEVRKVTAKLVID